MKVTNANKPVTPSSKIAYYVARALSATYATKVPSILLASLLILLEILSQPVPLTFVWAVHRAAKYLIVQSVRTLRTHQLAKYAILAFI